ncbi:MAG: transposase [Chloroflexi bacterium]|nr:transposase [Chloroflexota bacterium]
MTNHINAIPPIPRETERSARAIFGRKNFYILVGENLESILEAIQPELLLGAGIILPQITFFQFLEGLTDVQAVEAVRTRLDWKFALHLPVYPPTLPESALCLFRQQTLQDQQFQREFQRLIDNFVTFNPPLNDTFVGFMNLELVSHICTTNRAYWIQATMSQMLEVLAVRFPDWLRKVTLPHWYGRYNFLMSAFEMGKWPDQHELSMEEIAADIDHLLDEIHRSSPPGISELKEVKALESVWNQQIKMQLTDKCEILKSKDCDSCVYRTGSKEA